MEIHLPEFGIVALIGASGAGKSYFAARNFVANDIISFAQFAAITGDDGSDDVLHAATLALMHKAIEIRLQHRKPCVVDASLLIHQERSELRRLARKYHTRLSAIVLDTPLEICALRNAERPGSPDRHAIRQQIIDVDLAKDVLKPEGLRPVYIVSPETNVEVVRYAAPSDMRSTTGPFDIIGDVHGCFAELLQLVDKLGYVITPATVSNPQIGVHHPKGRKLIFVGDLCDRGPETPGVIQLVMDAVAQGAAYCVPGNHDDKLMRKLSGNNVQLKHGLETTMAQLQGADPAFLLRIKDFIGNLSSHLEFDAGKLVVAHAGLKAEMHGRSSGEIHSFCLYGETTGETDEFGLPVRHNWAADYTGKALVVYGHTPIPEPSWQNNTVNIDTGCVFGGELTALRYPERSTVSVPAHQIWCQPSRPMHWIGAQKNTRIVDHSISMAWTSPRVLVSTADRYNLNLEEGPFLQTALHLSKRAVHFRWLIYAPPTISPPTTSNLPGLLEHPAQAIDYFRKKGVGLLVARQIQHGTAVVIVLCRNAEAAERRFSLKGQGIGAVYTRSGRPYFPTEEESQIFLKSIAAKLESADVWANLQSEWLCMEAVVSPLGNKAPTHVTEVYGSVTTTASHAIAAAATKLAAAAQRGLDVGQSIAQLDRARHSLAALKAAAQQLDNRAATAWHLTELVAVEGQVFMNQTRMLQHTLLQQVGAALGEGFTVDELHTADLDSENSLRALTAWWESLNLQGQAGILIGPAEMKSDKESEMMQAWIKVRCKEHLRLLFGPAYDSPEMLQIHRERNLRLKRETAVREFSLAKEALLRFVNGQEFDAVFQCVFTQLGLETNPIDVRL